MTSRAAFVAKMSTASVLHRPSPALTMSSANFSVESSFPSGAFRPPGDNAELVRSGWTLLRTATDAPARLAAIAARRPDAPPPITRTSYCGTGNPLFSASRLEVFPAFSRGIAKLARTRQGRFSSGRWWGIYQEGQRACFGGFTYARHAKQRDIGEVRGGTKSMGNPGRTSVNRCLPDVFFRKLSARNLFNPLNWHQRFNRSFAVLRYTQL